MSSSEDKQGGQPHEDKEPPDLDLESPSGQQAVPNTQATSEVSQTSEAAIEASLDNQAISQGSPTATPIVSPVTGDSALLPGSVPTESNNDAETHNQASTIVPGLTDVGADELVAVLGSGVAPAPNVGTLMVDLRVSQSLMGLGLTDKPGSVPETGSVTPQGPVSVTETERKASTENQSHGTAMHRNGSSAPEGFEQATGTYHGPSTRPQEGAESQQDPTQDSEMETEFIDLTEDQDKLNDLSGPGSVTQTGQPMEQSAFKRHGSPRSSPSQADTGP